MRVNKRDISLVPSLSFPLFARALIIAFSSPPLSDSKAIFLKLSRSGHLCVLITANRVTGCCSLCICAQGCRVIWETYPLLPALEEGNQRWWWHMLTVCIEQCEQAGRHLDLGGILQVSAERTLLWQCVLDPICAKLPLLLPDGPMLFPTLLLSQLRPRLFSTPHKRALAEKKPQLNFMVPLLLPSWFYNSKGQSAWKCCFCRYAFSDASLHWQICLPH